jgi:exosortase family protein XrtM
MQAGRGLAISVGAFLAVFFLLQFGWQLLEGSRAEYVLLHYATAVPAAFFINLISPGESVHAVAAELFGRSGGLRVAHGCDGTEALFPLIAAFSVFRLSRRETIIGLLLGVLVVFVANQMRLILLFYANRAGRGLFDQMHGLIAPIFVVAVVGAYFYLWLWHAKWQRSSRA